MGIIADIRSIATGVSKAKRDWKAIVRFETRHKLRHDLDPEWECAEEGRAFYLMLGHDVAESTVDPFEHGAYSAIANRNRNREIAAKTPLGIHLQGPQVTVIPMEMSPEDGESPEDFFTRVQSKIEQALEDLQVLDEMESSNTDANNNDRKNKKGGK